MAVNEYGIEMGPYAPNQNNIFNQGYNLLYNAAQNLPSGEDITNIYGESDGSSILHGGKSPEGGTITNPFTWGGNQVMGSGGYKEYYHDTSPQAAINRQRQKRDEIRNKEASGLSWTPFKNISANLEAGKGMFGKEDGFGSGQGLLGSIERGDRIPYKSPEKAGVDAPLMQLSKNPYADAYSKVNTATGEDVDEIASNKNVNEFGVDMDQYAPNEGFKPIRGFLDWIKNWGGDEEEVEEDATKTKEKASPSPSTGVWSGLGQGLISLGKKYSENDFEYEGF